MEYQLQNITIVSILNDTVRPIIHYKFDTEVGVLTIAQTPCANFDIIQLDGATYNTGDISGRLGQVP